MTRAERRLAIDNPEIVPWALYLLGGAGEFIDVEAIAVRCYELAPERFGFRTFQLPNYKTFSKALRDLEKKYPSLLIRTADGLRRQLTAQGVEFVQGKSRDYERAFREQAANPPTRRRNQRQLNELRDNEMTRVFLAGGKPELARFEIADLLMCAPDSPPDEWLRRSKSLEASAIDSGRHDLAKFLVYVRDQRPELFGGEKV